MLNERSRQRLAQVHPDLAELVVRAEALAESRFGLEIEVGEGLRSIERQKQLVAAGASQTMKSRHLTGHAVDLHAVVNGEVRWDWPLYDKIAECMGAAAVEQTTSVTWGAAWKRDLCQVSAEFAKESYLEECRSAGRKPFLDGPHFELSWKEYPL